jgi:hypothetical protein
MKLIAHRGNIVGPDPINENSLSYIDQAISKGYDVEIDIRYDSIENTFYLGHDEPQYEVSLYWLCKRMEKLWIHCKNIDSLYYFASKTSGYNYFWHQEDDYTLTSKNYIWTYPKKNCTPKSIIVMEKSVESKDLSKLNCFGICSDYVGEII